MVYDYRYYFQTIIENQEALSLDMSTLFDTIRFLCTIIMCCTAVIVLFSIVTRKGGK